jgi:thioredoxin-like negative regulator of GroEL
MRPIVDGLAVEFSGQVNVARLDAALPANERLQAGYGLRGHPAFVVLDAAGSVTERFVGPQTAATLRAALTAVTP